MVLMTAFLFAPSHIHFSPGDSSVIFKRLDKDRQQQEEKKAKRKDRLESETRIGDKKVTRTSY